MGCRIWEMEIWDIEDMGYEKWRIWDIENGDMGYV